MKFNCISILAASFPLIEVFTILTDKNKCYGNHKKVLKFKIGSFSSELNCNFVR